MNDYRISMVFIPSSLENRAQDKDYMLLLLWQYYTIKREENGMCNGKRDYAYHNVHSLTREFADCSLTECLYAVWTGYILEQSIRRKGKNTGFFLPLSLTKLCSMSW